MSFLFGWLPVDARADAGDVAEAMSAALRVHDEQQTEITIDPGVAVGMMEPSPIGDSADDLTPARSADGRFLLWVAGEIAANDDFRIPLAQVDQSRTRAFR